MFLLKKTKLIEETLLKLSTAFTRKNKEEVITQMIDVIYGEVASSFYKEHQETIKESFRNTPFKESKFVKGRIASNKYKEGSTRLKNNGKGNKFKQIKINNNWIHYNKWIYEQKFGVKPTSREVVVFIDGNSENLKKRNLKLVNLKTFLKSETINKRSI